MGLGPSQYLNRTSRSRNHDEMLCLTLKSRRPASRDHKQETITLPPASFLLDWNVSKWLSIMISILCTPPRTWQTLTYELPCPSELKSALRSHLASKSVSRTFCEHQNLPSGSPHRKSPDQSIALITTCT